MLSLSDMNFLQSLSHSRADDRPDMEAAWQTERHSLLATIKSLRDLLADIQKTNEASQV